MYERRGAHHPIIRRILGYRKLAAAPLPIAPARLEQERFAWTSPETIDADKRFEHEPGPGASVSLTHVHHRAPNASKESPGDG